MLTRVRHLSLLRAALGGAMLLSLAGCYYLTPLPEPPPAPPAPKVAKPEPPPSAEALRLSPRRLVGRILAIDAARRFAFVALASDPPAAALVEGAELVVRTDELEETGRLRASRYTQPRTLGAEIIRGQPSPGDEVVYQAP